MTWRFAPLCKFHDRVHVARLPEQVNGDDGPNPRGDRCFDFSRIDVEAARIDVDEDLLCAETGDGADGGEERKGVMTSSPGPMPRAIMAARSASVPLDTPMPNLQEDNSATRSSSSVTLGPRMHTWESNTSPSAASTSCRMPQTGLADPKAGFPWARFIRTVFNILPGMRRIERRRWLVAARGSMRAVSLGARRYLNRKVTRRIYLTEQNRLSNQDCSARRKRNRGGAAAWWREVNQWTLRAEWYP